jgi:phosphohistidine phosphatase
MEIYIVRHAIAEEVSRHGGGDAERELTAEGRQKMKQAAEGFAALERKIDRIFSSPLVRARQTAEIFANALKLEVEEMDELSPAHSPKDVCTRLSSISKAKNVMLVGHEPNCSELASYLLVGSSGLEIIFKKGAICMIEAEQPTAGSGTLIFHLPPQALRQMAKA